jgi:hypothetical protein
MPSGAINNIRKAIGQGLFGVKSTSTGPAGFVSTLAPATAPVFGGVVSVVPAKQNQHKTYIQPTTHQKTTSILGGQNG